jgi:hypothetical protein
MSPSVKMPLPPGKLGIVFAGTPPVVKNVNDDSPLKGKVKAGYIFQSMILSDGTVFEGLSALDLIAVLNDYAEEEGRKLVMKMGVPDFVELSCPEGDLGITLNDVGGKAVITKIASTSPLKREIRVGIALDKLKLEDGMVISGHTAKEFSVFLADDNKSSGRVVELKNPALAGSPKSITLPVEKSIDLPVGPLGVSFKNSNGKTIISSIKEDSSLRGAARSGMAVDSFTMTDGTEFRGLSSEDLAEAIKNSVDAEGRKMLLREPNSKELPTSSTTKVYLPDIGYAEELGLSFVGTPAMFKDVSETSPLFGKARRGQLVLTVGWADGTEYSDLDSEELIDILEDSSGSTGRYLILKSVGNKSPTTTAVASREASLALPDELIVTLPAGKIGMILKGNPASVMNLKEDSPLIPSGVCAGMVIDTLTLESGEVLYELSATEFTDMLARHTDSEGRVVRFINPSTTELSRPPEIYLPDELELVLPTGKLSVNFKGNAPCKVSSVKKESPLRAVLPPGMAVDSLKIGSTTYIDMDAATLAGYLSTTSSVEGRVLTLKNPDVEGVEFQKVPDSLEVTLPSGKLGVALKGNPPVPNSYKEGSIVEGLFPTGMYIDMITLSDGTTMSGLSTAELVAVLTDSSNEIGRTLTFKNPKTTTPSPPGIILPDEKTITLPVGKLGVFFKGKERATVSRLQEDSPVRNVIRVGLVVDILDIPGSKRYSALTAKEVCRILLDTGHIEGRTMILKNPLTSRLASRSIIHRDDESVISQASDGGEEASRLG